jgi:hypothetical protein
MESRKRRLIILGLLLAPLITLHVLHSPRRGPFAPDPSYYMQVARHLADGQGLESSVSLYHEGLAPLPQPYDLYPLWPLVLGGVARVIGLFAAANVLPQLFFVLDLVLFYFLANRLAGDRGIFRYRDEEIDVGHLVVLLVGFNFIFFEATLYPYTEGLAFALAIGSFLLLDADRPALSGVLAALSSLTRYQMVLVPAATVGVLVVAFGVRRLAAYVGSGAVVGLIWFVYLRSIHLQRVDVGMYQEWVGSGVLHVLKGLAIAFNPASEFSYFHSFGPAVIIVLLAIPLLRRQSIVLWSLMATGVASTTVLARFESQRFPTWVFGSRHSLLFLFVIIPAVVITMVHGPRAIRIVALLLVAASIAQGAAAVFRYPLSDGEGLTPAESALVRWLGERHPRAAVLTTNAQALSVYSNNGFHWTECAVDPAKTRLMLRRLPIDYVIVYDHERSCPFVRGLSDVLQVEATFGERGRRVYLMRVIRTMTSTGALSTRQTATGWNRDMLSMTSGFDQSRRNTNIT